MMFRSSHSSPISKVSHEDTTLFLVLKEHFENVYGVDFSENRISYAKKYESDNLKFVTADLTETLSSKIPMKFDFMFTNAVIPHIPVQFKSDVFKNLAEIANPGCIFTMYDGMIP